MTAEFEPTRERRLKYLKEQLKDLISDEIKTRNQRRESLDEVERSRLDRRLEGIYQETEAVEQQINAIERTSSDPNLQYKQHQNDLIMLDFRKVKGEIDQLVNELHEGKRSRALMLMEESFIKAGHLYTTEMKNKFQTLTHPGKFRTYKIEFSTDSNPNIDGFLERLAKELNLPFEGTRTELTKAILEKLTQAVQTGSVVFFEIRQWDALECQETFFNWFIDEFWELISQRLQTRTATYSRVRLVGVIIVNKKLAKKCLGHSCWAMKESAPKKLKLSKWTAKEIENWLVSYRDIDEVQSASLAKEIYEDSERGKPIMVCVALEQRFLR